MLATCHSPREVAYVYNRRYRIPAELFHHQAFYLTGDALGAIEMPHELGKRVWSAIDRRFATPIIRHARAGSPWIYVVGPNQGHVRSRALAALKSQEGRVVPARTRVWLPMSDHQTGWTWHSQPSREEDAVPSRTRLLHTVLNIVDPDPVSVRTVR
ncbi:hypothetical protein [Nocardia sp. XZ_19_385]|uniref:hypothetical protein n=1 Tax=Nocardia sp. XZ_19_385 TaxID=2769488 RepID=UPI00188FA6FF|nr:hypothetical protein [Nocardia sp. XZ_19_385]